jgi:diketogulonate reductase-like aldo/keto reductase
MIPPTGQQIIEVPIMGFGIAAISSFLVSSIILSAMDIALRSFELAIFHGTEVGLGQVIARTER